MWFFLLLDDESNTWGDISRRILEIKSIKSWLKYIRLWKLLRLIINLKYLSHRESPTSIYVFCCPYSNIRSFSFFLIIHTHSNMQETMQPSQIAPLLSDFVPLLTAYLCPPWGPLSDFSMCLTWCLFCICWQENIVEGRNGRNGRKEGSRDGHREERKEGDIAGGRKLGQ